MFDRLLKKVKDTELFYNILFIFAVAMIAFGVSFAVSMAFQIPLEIFYRKNLINGKIYYILRFYVFFCVSVIAVFTLLTRIFKKYRFITKTFWAGYQNNNAKWALIGLAFGFAANGTGVLAALANGNITLVFAKPNFPYILLAAAAVLIQSFSEELMFRGFLFQAIGKAHKPWLAIVLPALAFSAAHFFNPGISFLGKLNIFLIGIVFALGVYCFKSFWWAATFHAAWNFNQNFIFGLPNSGLFSGISVFKLKTSSDSLFYSRDFGIEQSLTALIVEIILIAAIPLLGKFLNNRRICHSE